MNTFVLNDRGMTAWKATFDEIVVEPLPGGMRSLKVIADSVAVYERVLTVPEAAHLANLLTR